MYNYHRAMVYRYFYISQYADVCSRMLTYAHVCSCMLTYGLPVHLYQAVCSRVLTYADVC
jgi:hypothetical protein